MASDRDIYSVHAVRLVNFHNIDHAVIPVRDGGHLFLLGDNGSGKTTVLDAIHYVLSTGTLELNSAARLGGNRQDGRRINGVVTGYNVDFGGARFPEGRVTYAALELRNGHGTVISVGVGLSLTSERAPLQQWGFRFALPVAELPLVVQDAEGTEYPPDRERFQKEARRAGGQYFRSLEGFGRELAREFFPTQGQYEDYRGFLNICKAYREISSHASNYHELFKSLLPAPDAETLRELRDSLRHLRETSSVLLSLEKRCGFLGELAAFQREVEERGRMVEQLELGLSQLSCAALRRRLASEEECLSRLGAEAERLEGDVEAANKDVERLERTLTDLRAQDELSLVETERHRTRELSTLERAETEGASRLEHWRTSLAERTAALTAIQQELERIETELARVLAQQSTWLEAQGLEVPDTTATADAWHQLVRDLGSVEGRCLARLEVAERSLAGVRSQLQEREAERDALRERAEVYPQEPRGYGKVLADVASRFAVEPLYRRLRWRSGVSGKMRGAVEEWLGERLLGVMLTTEEQLSAVEAHVLAGSGGYGCAPSGHASGEMTGALGDFLTSCFEDDEALRVLWRLLGGESQAAPEFDTSEHPRWVRHHGEFRVLRGGCARLIGEAEREAERARHLATVTATLDELRKEVSQGESTVATERAALQQVRELGGALRGALQQHHQGREQGQRLEHECGQLTAQLRQEEERQGEVTRRRLELAELVSSLRQQIETRQLQNLEAEIARVSDQLATARSQAQARHDALTGQRTRLEMQARRRAEVLEQVEAAERNLSASLSAARLTEAGLGLMLSERGLTGEDALRQALADERQLRARTQGVIRARICQPEGADYGFCYDEGVNRLTSREQRDIGELHERLQAELAAQKQILTEDTRRNFERILLEQFRDSLRRRIHALETMHLLINRRLQGRQFGSHRYSLKLEPLPEYAPLIRVMKSFSAESPESAEDLKAIFEAHADEILDTPADRVPPILDYRNFYRYEMLLHTEKESGRVMDTRAKSVGSGGEQAVPNYLLVITIAHLLLDKAKGAQVRIRLNTILFDEAFYGIDQLRQNQLLAFADELGLQLVIASPNQDGIKPELARSTNVFVRKDKDYRVHLICYNWQSQLDLFDGDGSQTPHELS